MDPKISKKTQDTLGKIIKKPPLTDKLLSKPPFRFLHDVVTSVIKTTGLMKGLYPDSDLSSENVKDKESKIAFLQKAIDFVVAATGKQLTVKPAKVVAGHEPEKTNEFLQVLATAISSKVDNDDVIDKMKNKGGSSKKEEKKEERSKDREKSSSRDREKSSDRRKRDDDKKSRERSHDEGKSKDREERHKDRDDKHKDRDDKHKEKDDKHKDKDDKHKDKEDRHRERDRERDRESRHKSGRSRSCEKQRSCEPESVSIHSDVTNVRNTYDIDADMLESESERTNAGPSEGVSMDATFSVPNRTLMGPDQEKQDTSMKLIPRQLSTYRERRSVDEIDEEAFADEEQRVRTKRPKAARPRREQRTEVTHVVTSPNHNPPTPYGSEEDHLREEIVQYNTALKKAEITTTEQMDGDGRTVKAEARNGSDGRKVNSIAKHSRNDRNSAESSLKQQKPAIKRGPKTSTPKNSPDSPKRGRNAGRSGGAREKPLSKLGENPNRTPVKANSEKVVGKGRAVHRDNVQEHNVDATRGVTQASSAEKKHERAGKSQRSKRRSRETLDGQTEESESDLVRKSREKIRYRNDDFEHDKVKKSKKYKHKTIGNYEDELYEDEREVTNTTDEPSDESLIKHKRTSRRRHQRQPLEDEAYYIHKKPHTGGDRRKRSSFTTMLENSDSEKREDEGKENDAPRKDMTNGEADQKQADAAPVKMQRPSSAKGSRRRMEGVLDSSDEDVPAHRGDTQLNEDDLPPQVTAGRLARPSSARPAPPKRKEDVVHNEPAMRLGSGKPQNLIIDDGKESDEDETFVVEDSAPPPVEPDIRTTEENEEDDGDHGGLVKKIMETKKEYEQQRKTDIERPTISDAQRRKQREAVQREIDKLRSSIQTLTRSANPLGKIMDYVQEDLDSMQKELEKWKAENKEHALALNREKAITDRAVEPLKVQLSEVDQAIKDQLDLIGAVKSNIIRNDQKIEKMLRTIAKS